MIYLSTAITFNINIIKTWIYYDNLYDASDINQFLALSPAQFKKALAEVPKGLKTAIKIEVATRLDNGTFDSIQKVRAVDEICGTELEKMI